jgi:4-amino-4-deoxy-L-arabinose transferase-like glycosyltransferase
LSSWASALSITLFDDSAFFVRLPYLLVCGFIGWWIGKFSPKSTASSYLPGIILLSLPEFYLHSGVVSTDVFLTLSITVVMLSFWKSIQKEDSPAWGYLFFLGLGLGLLAKGPIIGVLTLPPILIWCLIQNNLISSLKKAPWVLGSFLLILIALPWYFLTEAASPGFIDYFIVGEHFNRYFNSGWVGDKYGFPKQQPFGIVWGFLIVFCLPWSLVFIQTLWRNFKKLKKDSWGLFLLSWILWTPLFFTTSTSLIHPYILPVTIPMALWIHHYWDEIKLKILFLKIGLAIPFLILITYLSGLANSIFENNTDKYLIKNKKNVPVYALDFKSYSSQFYTQGKIKIVDTFTLHNLILNKDDFNIIIDHSRLKLLSTKLQESLTPIESNKKRAMYVQKSK